MIFRSKNKRSVQNENLNTPTKERQFWNSTLSQNDWVSEMYAEHVKKGAFDDLPGKGKPLDIQSGDAFSGILKNANVLPDWILLQHEIRDQLQHLLSILPNGNETHIKQEIDEINIKIKKYNNLVPTHILHKRTITRENMEGQYPHWV